MAFHAQLGVVTGANRAPGPEAGESPHQTPERHTMELGNPRRTTAPAHPAYLAKPQSPGPATKRKNYCDTSRRLMWKHSSDSVISRDTHAETALQTRHSLKRNSYGGGHTASTNSPLHLSEPNRIEGAILAVGLDGEDHPAHLVAVAAKVVGPQLPIPIASVLLRDDPTSVVVVPVLDAK